MGTIVRKSIAFEREELAAFDKTIKNKQYKNRSEAIRDLVRSTLVEHQQTDGERVMMASLTIVYDHDDHDVQHELTHAQHDAGALIISTLHTHMDKHNCLEVIVLRGKVKDLHRLADTILATKGVRHGRLVITSS